MAIRNLWPMVNGVEIIILEHYPKNCDYPLKYSRFDLKKFEFPKYLFFFFWKIEYKFKVYAFVILFCGIVFYGFTVPFSPFKKRLNMSSKIAYKIKINLCFWSQINSLSFAQFHVPPFTI